jgi:hypothetical protein
MAEVDTSIYRNAPKAPDMLGTLQGVMGIQGQMNQNKLFQQQFNTNLGVSQIYKDAIDPQTGTLDPAKLRALMAGPQGNNITLGMPQAIQNSQEAQQRNLNIDTAQIDLARKNMQTAEGYLSPLLAHKNPTSSEVLSALSEAMTKGHLNQKVALDVFSSLPRDPQGQIDETKIRPWLQEQQLRMMDMQKRFDAMFPAPTMVPTGQQTLPMRLPQIGEPTQAGPGIQQQLPPSTPVFNPATNQPGYMGPQAGAGQPQGQGGAPGSGGGFIPSGPALGVEAAANESAADSAKQLSALRSEVGGSANRIFQLQQASKSLEGALTGKGSQPIQDWRSLLVTLGAADEATAQGVKDFDQAKKYMIGAMLNRGAGLGINTNEKLAALSGASANTDISKLAAKDILKTMVGLEKGQQAQFAAFERAGLPPEKFASWAANWNKDRDLRAYAGFVDMKPAERVSMINKLKPAEKAKFMSTLKEAVDIGVLPLSDFAK